MFGSSLWLIKLLKGLEPAVLRKLEWLWCNFSCFL